MNKTGTSTAIQTTAKVEALMDALVWLTHNHQYNASSRAISDILKSSTDTKIMGPLNTWQSIFTGHTFIINRITPEHRDTKGFPRGFDYLSVSGTAESILHLPDLNLQCTYKSGTVVALAGRVLRHRIERTTGGDRICIARWIRKAVLTNERKGEDQLVDLPWSTLKDFENRLSMCL